MQTVERDMKRRGKGKLRLSASPAYAGEVGGIGDDSGVLFSRSRAVIWKDRHDPFGNMAFACLCGAPSLIVISKCSKNAGVLALVLQGVVVHGHH